MVYNLTTLASNATGLLGFLQGVNAILMFGWFGTSILIGIVIVCFASFMFVTNDTNKAVAASAFIAFTLSVMLRAVNLVPNITLFITLIAAGCAIAFTWGRT